MRHSDRSVFVTFFVYFFAIACSSILINVVPTWAISMEAKMGYRRKSPRKMVLIFYASPKYRAPSSVIIISNIFITFVFASFVLEELHACLEFP
jgi:hypothetical protein